MPGWFCHSATLALPRCTLPSSRAPPSTCTVLVACFWTGCFAWDYFILLHTIFFFFSYGFVFSCTFPGITHGSSTFCSFRLATATFTPTTLHTSFTYLTLRASWLPHLPFISPSFPRMHLLPTTSPCLCHLLLHCGALCTDQLRGTPPHCLLPHLCRLPPTRATYLTFSLLLPLTAISWFTRTRVYVCLSPVKEAALLGWFYLPATPRRAPSSPTISTMPRLPSLPLPPATFYIPYRHNGRERRVLRRTTGRLPRSFNCRYHTPTYRPYSVTLPTHAQEKKRLVGCINSPLLSPANSCCKLRRVPDAPLSFGSHATPHSLAHTPLCIPTCRAHCLAFTRTLMPLANNARAAWRHNVLLAEPAYAFIAWHTGALPLIACAAPLPSYKAALLALGIAPHALLRLPSAATISVSPTPRYLTYLSPTSPTAFSPGGGCARHGSSAGFARLRWFSPGSLVLAAGSPTRYCLYLRLLLAHFRHTCCHTRRCCLRENILRLRTPHACLLLPAVVNTALHARLCYSCRTYA